MMRYAKEFYRFLKHVLGNRKLLLTLIKNDFKKQYLGSYLGLAWAFVQPLVFMITIWFVFEIGFRAAPSSGDMPFFLWLISGMIPWFFILNALTSGTNAIIGNAFLVKKVAFRVSILPLVQVGSAFIIHVALVMFIACAFFLYGFKPTIYWLQLPYYMLCAIVLILGISWLTSSIRVFVKDVANIVAVVLQIGFWATPIFWNIQIVPEKYRYLIELNPFYYITEGYRNTFIHHIWFWENMNLTAYFMIISSLIFILGAVVFKRLRVHFGDVL